MHVIVRISRADVVHNAEAAVFRILRDTAADVARPTGLQGLVLARHVTASGGVELLSITLWQDIDAMAVAFGERWDRPTSLAGLDGLLANQTVEHFEAVAAEYQDLVRLAVGPVDRPGAGTNPEEPAQ
jgi:heme-degrading monooxygenase HmoA